ncbi:Hypothetical protein NTJ_00388 [Nesidiocoris tenuis]|uniref:SRCR domain-containing protein n=1 Tax=Nesidiocoris tenuis TaxID=355587 RepID=A0ABN7A5T9_9HEMI|nr:Hypothetical protein NTJ_00388 [Nesidiocoris tenuis]
MFAIIVLMLVATGAELNPPSAQCSASHDEAGLRVEPCTGIVRVVGTQGSHVFHCDNLGNAVFYGPVHITVEHMTCETMTREPCAELIDQQPFSINCRDAWHHVTWAMIVGAGVVAGSIFFTLRIRSVHTRVSHSGARITRRRFTLSGAIYEWEEPGDPEFRGDRFVTPVVTCSRRVWWTRLIMWSVVFWVQPAVAVDLHLSLNPGTSLTIGDGLIITQGTEMRHNVS